LMRGLQEWRHGVVEIEEGAVRGSSRELTADHDVGGFGIGAVEAKGDGLEE
jgi:hypothetical protein